MTEKTGIHHDTKEVARKLLVPLIPAETARRYRILPWDISRKVLTLAMEDPENWNAMDLIRFRTGFEIETVRKSAREMDELLDFYYPREKTILQELAEELRKEGEGIAGPGGVIFSQGAVNLGEIANQAPVVRWVNRILQEGLAAGASDIHFESCTESFRVRFRRDGLLFDLERLPKGLSRPVIARLKVMASLDISESRLPQDGRIQVQEGKRTVDLRISTLPTFAGESVVLRVLDQDKRSLALEELGFDSGLVAGIREILMKPNGMFLVTGPTGSGKTTTLYACLGEIDTRSLKVVTVEDPVEYERGDVVQIPAHERIGLTFPKILRAILRHDPDVVLVGEIRDEVTAKIALQASLTGHLVLATLHTNDAPGAVTRLMEMGLEPYLIAASLKGVLAQRLMRKLCTRCLREIPENSPALCALTELHTGNARIFEARGCEECHGFGYRGRAAVGEFFRITPEIRPLVAEGAALETIRQKAIATGMSPLIEDAHRKLIQGISSLDEYLRFRTGPESRGEALS